MGKHRMPGTARRRRGDREPQSLGKPPRQFRVWIARYQAWRPPHARAVPPQAVALEPAEVEPMTAGQAAAYAQAFNRAALARSCKLWALVLPVVLRYEGEPRPGQTLLAGRVR